MKIAIQGHPTRGKEVIQILESLGGRNIGDCLGTRSNKYYYLDPCLNISATSVRYNFKESEIFTLEEFEEEFPFKIGDEVIIPDYSNKKGTIVSIEPCGPILSYFIKLETGNGVYRSTKSIKLYKEMKEERNIKLTLDKAKEWYQKGGELKEIALQAFTEKELNSLPRSWEEFCRKYPIKGGMSYIDIGSNIRIISSCDNDFRSKNEDKNLCPSKESAEAHLALMQLEQLRDCWRQGWKPDWSDAKQAKCYICYYQGKFKISTLYETRCFLSFPTYEMAEEFLKCFKDLIEKAGDLI